MPEPSTSSGDRVTEEARRRAWLDARGVADLPVPVDAALRLETWDDATGAFRVTVRVEASGVLLRRPRADRPWPDADALSQDVSYRWSDPRWDWCLAGDRPISDEQLALLKVRLAATT
jgi:hypothetical protein